MASGLLPRLPDGPGPYPGDRLPDAVSGALRDRAPPRAAWSRPDPRPRRPALAPGVRPNRVPGVGAGGQGRGGLAVTGKASGRPANERSAPGRYGSRPGADLPS